MIDSLHKYKSLSLFSNNRYQLNSAQNCIPMSAGGSDFNNVPSMIKKKKKNSHKIFFFFFLMRNQTGNPAWTFIRPTKTLRNISKSQANNVPQNVF